MAAPVGLWAFAAGELAPGLWGRIDYAKYQIGLSTCRNAFISYRGGAYSRAGTAFVGYSRQTVVGTLPPRLITFQFNLNQGICIEAGNFYFRFIIDGAFVLEPPVTITGITNASPAVVTAANSYAADDWLFLTGMQGMTELNGRTIVAQAVSPTQFALFDVFGNPIDTTAYPAYTGGGTAARVYTLTTPWAEADLQWLKWAQSADVMSICCWNQQTNTAILATGDIAFTVNPSNGDTITLNGVVWTFTTGVATGNETKVQGTLALTMTQLASDLNASVVPALAVATYSATATQLDITYDTPGVTGNTYTLAASVATPNASSLTGGDISYPPYDLRRITDTDWTLTPFSAGASVEPPTNLAGRPTNQNTGPDAPNTQYQAVVTTVNQLTGEESVASAIHTFGASVDISSIAGSLPLTWNPPADAGQVYYNAYFAPPAVLGTVPAGSLFGFTGSSYGNGFVNTNIEPDFSQVPPLHLDPFQPGQILFVTITNGGTNITSVTATITTSTGSGFSGYPIINNKVLTAYVVDNGGKLYRPGDAIVFNGAAFATGAITFSVNPSNGDTVTLNGVVWTFVTSGATGAQTNIKATLSDTLDQLVTDLSESVNPLLTVASYTDTPTGDATSLIVTYNTSGAGGDAYTLAASVAVPSGPTLTGGGGAGTLAGTIDVGPETGTYPSVVQYFQQRRFYAATPNQPDTYFASQPGAFNNFDFRIPTIDSDAITGNPWSVQVNGIQQMEPVPGGLFVGTGVQAWLLGGAGSSPLQPQAITPSNQQAEAQAYNGCSAYMPIIRKDYDQVYLQALGSIFRNTSYNIYAGVYTGTDITYLSSHLFTGIQMRESAWCEDPFKIIWVTRQDGLLLSFTFFKEQDVMAWARHDTQGLTWSVTSVIEPPVDALYLATERQFNLQRSFMIERQDNRTWNGVETTWCVDAGLSLSQPAPNAGIAISPLDGLGSIASIENFQGGNSYSAGTTATIKDPTGSGAVLTVAIVNGVLQPPVIVSGGAGYTNPVLILTDPSGTGALASGTVVIGNTAQVIATDPVFSAQSVGHVIRGSGGIATVTAYTDPEHVTVNVTQPFLTGEDGAKLLIILAGGWTMTEPISSVVVPHLVGATVTGIADGQVIPLTPVGPGGIVTLATPASQITIGVPFQVQIQTLRPAGGQPTTQGQRKSFGAVTARVEQSLGFKIGVNQPDGSAQSPMVTVAQWNGMTPVPPPGKPIGLPPYQSSVIPLFTDDVRVPQANGWDKHGQVALQQDQPLPLQLLAVIGEFLEGDIPDVAVAARAPGSTAPAKTPYPY